MSRHDDATAKLLSAVDAVFLLAKGGGDWPGFAEAQDAWNEIHRERPDYARAHALAVQAALRDFRWGALRASVESMLLHAEFSKLAVTGQ